jgi:predicted lipid carrier protein YhbT
MKLPPPSRVLKPVIGFALRNGPFAVQKVVVEKLLREAFAEAREDGDLEFLEGRCMAIDMPDIRFYLAVSLRDNQLILVKEKQAADVVIRGEINEFIRVAARKEDPDTLFFQRRLSIEGDTELGLAVKNLMDSVDLTTLPQWMQQGIKVADHFQHTVLTP